MVKHYVDGVLKDMTPEEESELVNVTQAPPTQAEIDAELDRIADAVMTNRGALRAFALVVLDEINEFRADHGRSAYTVDQMRTAVRNRING